MLRQLAKASLPLSSTAGFHRSSAVPKSLEHEFYLTLSQDISKELKHRGMLDTKTRRIVITGVGTISPLGTDTKEVFDKAMQGETGVRPVVVEDDDDDDDNNIAYQKYGIHYCSDVPFHWKQDCDSLCGGLERAKSPAVRFAEYATLKSLLQADWNPTGDYDKFRTGVCIGNSMVDLDYIAKSHSLVTSGKGKKVSPYFVPRILCNMASGFVAIRHGFRGPNHTASTACSTGAHSIGDAFFFIKSGQADVMVAGGTDTCINALSLVGFNRLRALSTKFVDDPRRASRPFDKDRDGFVMAEGAAVLVLEELQHALKRGANIYCEVIGYGASCDADHITAAKPDGAGALLAVMRAFSNANVMEDIDDELWLVNAHATSTPLGDVAEMNAVRGCLGLIESHQDFWNVRIPHNGPYVTAHKSNLGHMIGAAGAIESSLAAISLQTGQIPGILNLDEPEEGIGKGVQLVRESIYESEKKRDTRRLVLKNSFGFGGTNVSLLFAEYIPGSKLSAK
uniref:beta-ketoacyl-[acyl-carrier-protein] synthase I n=1 Tax=Paracyclopina nana TaxID=565004 RepID=A0A1L3THU2_PARNA|nr:KAS [Paracyclopina nana]